MKWIWDHGIVSHIILPRGSWYHAALEWPYKDAPGAPDQWKHCEGWDAVHQEAAYLISQRSIYAVFLVERASRDRSRFALLKHDSWWHTGGSVLPVPTTLDSSSWQFWLPRGHNIGLQVMATTRILGTHRSKKADEYLTLINKRRQCCFTQQRQVNACETKWSTWMPPGSTFPHCNLGVATCSNPRVKKIRLSEV